MARVGKPPCRGVATLVPLTVKNDARGALQVINQGDVPFPIRRIFVISGMPGDAVRADHAHRTQHQFLVCTAGSVAAEVDDGAWRSVHRLAALGPALHSPPLTWVTLRDPSPDCVLTVLCDGPYDPAEYISDRAEFARLAGARR